MFYFEAHCVAALAGNAPNGFRNISVYMGVTNLADTRGLRKQIKKCTLGDPAKAPYVPGNPGANDLALCELDADIAPAPLIYGDTALPLTPAPITLITVLNDYIPGKLTTGAIVNSTRCKVAGWGSTSMINLGTGLYTNYLQELSVSLLDVVACNRMWPK